LLLQAIVDDVVQPPAPLHIEAVVAMPAVQEPGVH